MRRWIGFFVVVFVLCLFLNVSRAFAASSEEAASDVSSAESALRVTFGVVFDAERAGANVSGLMERLTAAGDDLTNAEVAMAAGNYSDAVSRAGACKSVASSVAGDAGVSKSEAIARASGWIITSFSVVGSAAFVAVLFLVWRLFKRNYKEKLFESRIEVTA